MEEKRRSNTEMTFGASLYGIWYSSYLPTVLVIALIIATPMRASRKGWALLWGLILVHGFIILCLFINLLTGFNQSKDIGLVVLSPFWENILLSVHKVLVNDIGSKYIVAIFIWLIVVMRRNEWMTLAEKFNLYPADNRLDGKENLHSLIKPPHWVVARKLPDGTVQLKWAPVKEATGYQVYRQKPNQNQLKPYKSLSRAVTVTKCKTAKAQFCDYAIASIGLVNEQKIVSVLSDKVTVKRGN